MQNTAHHGKAARVLVVDDCQDSADSMSWILSAHGYEVEVAYDGNAALMKARRHTPDIILLDLGLPEMDGYQVAAALRDEADGQPPLLVAITGYGREDDKRQSAATGFKFHLTKPVDPAALLETLAKV